MKREWNRQEIEEIKKTQEKEIYRFFVDRISFTQEARVK